MVKAMNKKELIEELEEKLMCNKETSETIVSIFEDNFFISKSSKSKIVSEVKDALKITEREAINIYDETISLIQEEIKYRLKHPFKSKN